MKVVSGVIFKEYKHHNNIIGKAQKGTSDTSTYAKLTKCSSDTALRDLQDLVAKEMLKAEDSGKKTNYIIISPKNIRIPKIADEKTPVPNNRRQQHLQNEKYRGNKVLGRAKSSVQK